MAPLMKHFLLVGRSQQPSSDFAAAQSQWQNPTDVLTVLMIIGGDTVRRALASLAGSRDRTTRIAPVAFSFGWVSYAFSAILSVVGDHRLLPDPDYDCILVNAKSGQSRRVKSFSLARLLRDYRLKEEQKSGLAVAFFCTVNSKRTGDMARDWVFHFSFAIITLQILLSIIPIIVHQRYIIFILTVGGTILALVGSTLPQWQKEKWAARPLEKRDVVCLTSGNGSSVVMVIVSEPESNNEGVGNKALRLEDLAGGRDYPMRCTHVATITLAAFWIIHLITVQSLDADGWFSLGIGALGMVQNVVAAGASRTPAALGFHIVPNGDPVRDGKVFEALMKADDVEPRVGLSLLPVFFPGELRPKEIERRDRRKAELDAQKGEGRMTAPSQPEILLPAHVQVHSSLYPELSADDSSRESLSSSRAPSPLISISDDKTASTSALLIPTNI